MLVKTFCAAVTGLEATTITIEVNISRGVMFHLSGMADTAVRESYDRIRVALPNVGFKVPVSNITVNLSPADIRKEGSSYDLPMAIGILAANGNLKADNSSPSSPARNSSRVSSCPRRTPLRLPWSTTSRFMA